MSAALQASPLAPFAEVLLLRSRVFGDARGFFLESFRADHFAQATGLASSFVQDNHSRSVRGVLRGIHFQRPPHAQGKLVRVARGSVFDVAVDLRRSSPTFGRWAGCTLREASGEMLWIPPGFGHAFVALEDGTDFLYKTTDFYAPECEGSVAWDDPEIGIRWPESLAGITLQLSDKDRSAPRLRDAVVFD